MGTGRGRVGRWRGRRHPSSAAAPPWMQPLPTGPVRFDPALHTAAELVGAHATGRARRMPSTDPAHGRDRAPRRAA